MRAAEWISRRPALWAGVALGPAAFGVASLATVAAERGKTALAAVPAAALAAVILGLTFRLVEVRKTFFLAILLFPLIKGFTLRLGAQWEPYLIPAYLLLGWMLLERPTGLDSRALVPAVLLAAISLAGTLTTYLFFGLPSLSPEVAQQIVSPAILSVVEHVRFLGALSIFVAVGHFVRTREDLVEALGWFSKAAVAVSIYMLYEFVVRILELPLPLCNEKARSMINLKRTFGTFYEPTTAGDFTLIGLFLILILFSLKGRPKGLERFSPLLILLALLSTFSMTALCAGLAGLAAVSASSLKTPVAFLRRISLLLVLLSPLVAVWYFVEPVQEMVEHRMNIFAGDGNEENEAGRNLWQRIEEHFSPEAKGVPMTNPVIGMGNSLSATYVGNYPMFFRIPTEFGIAGTLVFLFIGVSAFRSIRASRALGLEEQQPLFLGMFASTMVFIFNYNTPNEGWIWFLFGLFLSLRRLNQIDSGVPKPAP